MKFTCLAMPCINIQLAPSHSIICRLRFLLCFQDIILLTISWNKLNKYFFSRKNETKKKLIFPGKYFTRTVAIQNVIVLVHENQNNTAASESEQDENHLKIYFFNQAEYYIMYIFRNIKYTVHITSQSYIYRR